MQLVQPINDTDNENENIATTNECRNENISHVNEKENCTTERKSGTITRDKNSDLTKLKPNSQTNKKNTTPQKLLVALADLLENLAHITILNTKP